MVYANQLQEEAHVQIPGDKDLTPKRHRNSPSYGPNRITHEFLGEKFQLFPLGGNGEV